MVTDSNETPKTDASVAYNVAKRMQLEFIYKGDKAGATVMMMVREFFRGLMKDEHQRK